MLNGEEVQGKRRSSLANSPKNKLGVVQLKMKGMEIGGYFKACILKVKSEHGCVRTCLNGNERMGTRLDTLGRLTLTGY